MPLTPATDKSAGDATTGEGVELLTDQARDALGRGLRPYTAWMGVAWTAAAVAAASGRSPNWMTAMLIAVALTSFGTAARRRASNFEELLNQLRLHGYVALGGGVAAIAALVGPGAALPRLLSFAIGLWSVREGSWMLRTATAQQAAALASGRP